MKQRLIAGVARAAFGALFVLGCAAAAWAMPPSALIEALPAPAAANAQETAPAPPLESEEAAPSFEPPTPRVAPEMGQVLLASGVLRTLDGQAWTPPASLAAAPATEAIVAPVVETAPSMAPAAPIVVETPIAIAPALPPLAVLEFNPAAVAHSGDIETTANESADRLLPATRVRQTSQPSAAPPIVVALAPNGELTGAHAVADRAPYQVQALMAAVRAPLPQSAPIPAPVQFVANPAPEAPAVQIAQADITPAPPAPLTTAEPAPEIPLVAPMAAPVVIVDLPQEKAASLPPQAEALPAPIVAPVPEVAAPVTPAAVQPNPALEAPMAPVRKPSLGGPALAADAPLMADASDAAPLLQKAAYSDPQPRANWRDIINPIDKVRLKNLLPTRIAAIKQAEAAIDSGDKAAVAAAPSTSSVLYANPMAAQETDLAGEYRCRITRLGGPYPQLTAYRFTTCAVTQWPDGSLVLEKTSGTDRFIGRLWREADSSFVYLGTVMPDEGTPWAYDEKPALNQVGRLYRIGQKRLRLELPKPNTGSALDIVEFVRLK